MAGRAHIEVTGNVGGDPEFRKLNNGTEVGSFSVAVNSKRGEDSITTWYRAVSYFDKLNDVIDKYVRKGDTIQIAGDFLPREWTDRDNAVRYTNEVTLRNFGDLVLLGDREGGGQGGGRAGADDRGGRGGGGGGGNRGGDRDGGAGARGASRAGGRDEPRGGGRSDDRGRGGGRDSGGRDEGRGGGGGGTRGGNTSGGAGRNDNDLDDEIPF